jgi:basic amino acid/polyamine antiporter, APA family
VQMRAVVLAQLTAVCLAAAMIALLEWRFGRSELSAGAYLLLANREALPGHVVPLFWLSLDAFWPGTALYLAFLMTSGCWIVMCVPGVVLAAARVLQAMGADRQLPEWLVGSTADHRRGARTLLLFGLLSVVPSVLYAYASFWRLALDVALLTVICSAVTCVGGALAPFLHRERYRESTAAPYEVYGVPVITVAGTLFTVFAVAVLWQIFSDQRLSIGAGDRLGRLLLVGLYLLSMFIFMLRRLYRRRREGAKVELFWQSVGGGGARDARR